MELSSGIESPTVTQWWAMLGSRPRDVIIVYWEAIQPRTQD